MTDIVESCLSHTKRTYPDGYGFALIYLDNHLNPAHLRDAADALVAMVYSGNVAMAGQAKKDPELVAYVVARANAECAEGFLIEAAQFVHGWAMARNKQAIDCMKICGHPGFN
jgi:hypothetical protein